MASEINGLVIKIIEEFHAKPQIPPNAWNQKALENYYSRLQSLTYLIFLPMHLVARTAIEDEWKAEALVDLIFFGRESADRLTAETYEQMALERQNQRSISYPQKSQQQILTETIDRSHHRIDQWDRFNDIPSGLESLLKFAVTEAYSIFEVFAADLWMAAVNAGDDRIKSKAFQAVKKKEKDFLIELIDLKFDASHLIGTALRKSDCVSFRSLDQINASFALILNDEDINKNSGSSADVCKIFELDNDIRLLSAVRNIIVHNSGNSDKQFRSQTCKFENFRSIPDNIKITLDGDLTFKLIIAAMRTCESLAKAVSLALTA